MPDRWIETGARKLRTFKGLGAEQIRHPDDKAAFDALEKIPLIRTIVAEVMEHGLEPLLRYEIAASSVRVTETVYPRLYERFKWACQILDLAEPELYTVLDPAPNAYTTGHTNAFVVVTSGLLKEFDDDEMLYVLGHELGHVKAEHVLYKTVARNLSTILQYVGSMTFGIGELVGTGASYALLYWDRQSELTADRAGLICSQSVDSCVSALMKLAGGLSNRYGACAVTHFKKQVDAFVSRDLSTVEKCGKAWLTAGQDHPFPVHRTKELCTWHDQVFSRLLALHQQPRAATTSN